MHLYLGPCLIRTAVLTTPVSAMQRSRLIWFDLRLLSSFASGHFTDEAAYLAITRNSLSA
jgi:hypothetical protein